MIEQGDEGHELFVIRPPVMSGFFGHLSLSKQADLGNV